MCFSHPSHLLYSFSFSFLPSQSFLFQLNYIQQSSVAQFPLSDLLHTWISNFLVCATLSSFSDHLSHILQGFCICEITVPCTASFIKPLHSALRSGASTLPQHHVHHLISILPLLANPPLKILLIEEFPFLSNPFVSNIVAPTCASSLGSEREWMVVDIPLWSPYPVNRPPTVFPPTGHLLSSLCFKVPELISALGWQIRSCGTCLGCQLQFSPSPPRKHLPGEKTEDRRIYGGRSLAVKRLKHCVISRGTTTVGPGAFNRRRWSTSTAWQTHTYPRNPFFCAFSWHTRANNTQQLLCWSGARSSEGWQIVSKLGWDWSLQGDTSPALSMKLSASLMLPVASLGQVLEFRPWC